MHQPRTEPRTGVNWRRLLAALAIVLAVLYSAALAWLISQETRLVFRAPARLGDARPPFPHEQIDLPRSDGARQFAWLMRTDSPYADRHAWLIYLHGNASTIAGRANIARYRELHGLGLNIIAPEYRGYAGLAGTPSESALDEDSGAAYDYLTRALHVPAQRIVIFGWSLGSAVAVNLASKVDSGALILEGAPASLVAIGQREYPIFPIRLVMRNPFESILKIGRVEAPVLLLHSPEDEVIPIDEGRRLYEAARSDKTFVEVRGGHIYPAERDPGVYVGAIRKFLGDRGLLHATP
jgi:fermentation-respiration switch protein FrsA (DUF1100 family)